MGRMIRRLLPIVLVLAATGPAGATEVRGDLELEAALGYDSNPLQVPASAPGSAFTDLALGGQLEVDMSRRAGFFLGGSGALRLHPAETELSDTGWAELRTGFTFTPFRRGRRLLSLSVGGLLGTYRATFIDPATGEVFLSGADPLGARFDHDSFGAFLGLRWRTSRRVMLLLDGEMLRRRFVEDYADLGTVDPLDDTAVQIRPGVRVLVSDRVLLDVTVPVTVRGYEGLPALDEAGDPVPDALREYRTAGLGVALRIDPSERWEIALGLQGNDRVDLQAGFYDSLARAAFASVSFFPGELHAIRLLASYSDLDYDVARVGDSIDGFLRGGSLTRAQVGYERRLGRHVAWLVEAGALRSDNLDPLFTYDQQWGRTGFRFQL